MSEIYTGQIDQLQQDVVDRLTASKELAGIEVIYEKTKDIENAITQALGPMKGICIIVTPPVCTVERPNLPGPYFDGVTVDVNILENVIINQGASGTKKTASYVAELVAKQLHRFVTRDQRCLTVGGIRPVVDPLRVYRVPIKTAFGLK
jgi:hypothetical protein